MTLQTASERPTVPVDDIVDPPESRHSQTQPRRPRSEGVWRNLGLTMLIPFFLATVMGLAYLGAFHQPEPHHLPVAVVGESAGTLVFAQTLKNDTGEALDVRTVTSADTARQLIEDREIYAAYAPGQDTATLFVSSAASETTANIAQKVFLPVAYEAHLPLQIEDVVPAGEHDTTGQGLFFLLVALSIGGYASAIPISGHMGRFRLAGRFGLAAAAGAIVAGIGMVIAGPIYHIVQTAIWGSWLISWLYVTAIVLLGMGLHPMLKHWTTPVLTLLFVALNFTSSGGIFVPEVQPGLFAGLSTFWNGEAWLHAVQTLAYFAGQPIGWDLLRLALWLVPGALLVVLTHRWSVRKTRLADENAALSELDEAGAA
ncbi:hypothetical protein [Arthrobacter sp. JSM 101049]|uniref:hypothetical protein n=1 Tax=Arthrobacter sp. JSM 101049 TaxID=929097 RepID=UPI0035661FDE